MSLSQQESVFPSSTSCCANMSTSNLSTGETASLSFTVSSLHLNPPPTQVTRDFICPQWMALIGCVFLSVLSASHLGSFTCGSFLLTSLNRKCSLLRFLLAESVS